MSRRLRQISAYETAAEREARKVGSTDEDRAGKNGDYAPGYGVSASQNRNGAAGGLTPEAEWRGMFTSTADRIAKERAAFGTPAGQETSTERGNRWVNSHGPIQHDVGQVTAIDSNDRYGVPPAGGSVETAPDKVRELWRSGHLAGYMTPGIITQSGIGARHVATPQPAPRSISAHHSPEELDYMPREAMTGTAGGYHPEQELMPAQQPALMPSLIAPAPAVAVSHPVPQQPPAVTPRAAAAPAANPRKPWQLSRYTMHPETGGTVFDGPSWFKDFIAPAIH